MVVGALPGAARGDAFEREWCEVDAGGLRLISDHPRTTAEDMVALLQRFRPVAQHYLPGSANADDPPLTVVVFARGRDFYRAMGGRDVAGYMQPSFTESLMVVGPDAHAHSEHESLLHEYVHYLLRTRRGLNIPSWFDEGLAGLLSSARVEGDHLAVGALPKRAMERTMDDSHLSLQEVLTAEDLWDWHPRRRRSFYAWSRLLVHRLMLGDAAGRDDYRGALTEVLRGAHTSLPEAVQMSAPALERRLIRYLDRAPEVRHGSPPPPALNSAYRCLGESEKVARLSLAVLPQNPDEAARRLRAGVDADPDNAELWTALSLAEEGRGERRASLAAARHAVHLAPDDVSANVRLAGALAMGCILEVSTECRARWQEAVPLLRQALRRDPTRQDAIFTLGLAYLYSGRAGDALNYLRIAHQRQPWAPQVNFYLGESYRLIGDRRAAAHLQRAQRWSPTELWRKLAEAGLELLNDPGGGTPG